MPSKKTRRSSTFNPTPLPPIPEDAALQITSTRVYLFLFPLEPLKNLLTMFCRRKLMIARGCHSLSKVVRQDQIDNELIEISAPPQRPVKEILEFVLGYITNFNQEEAKEAAGLAELEWFEEEKGIQQVWVEWWREPAQAKKKSGK